MNHQQIREELSKAEQTQKSASESIARLTKLLNEPEGCWKPKVGGEYWIAGYPCPLRVSYSADAEDAFWFSIGEAFPTKEAAELHVKKLKVIQKLRELAGGFKPDWGNSSQTKWCVKFCHEGKRWAAESWYSTQQISQVYFQTSQAAQAAITTLGDELNVLLEQ